MCILRERMRATHIRIFVMPGSCGEDYNLMQYSNGSDLMWLVWVIPRTVRLDLVLDLIFLSPSLLVGPETRDHRPNFFTVNS